MHLKVRIPQLNKQNGIPILSAEPSKRLQNPQIASFKILLQKVNKSLETTRPETKIHQTKSLTDTRMSSFKGRPSFGALPGSMTQKFSSKWIQYSLKHPGGN